MAGRKRADEDPEDPSPEALLALFEAFVPRYVAYVKRGVAATDLTPMRLNALTQLAEAGPEGLAMGALARALGVTPYAVTKIVDGLERDDLVARSPHPTDRRATLLGLTPRGRAALDEGSLHHRENMARLVGVIDPADRASFARVMRAMIAFVDRRSEGG